MADFLLVVLVALALGYFFGEVSHRLRLPRVVGQILAGAMLGLPAAKAYLFEGSSPELFSFLASVGSILLFFFVGLEVNLREFRSNVKKAFFVSFFNTALPFVAGFVVMLALGFDAKVALVVGVAAAVSSVAASVDFLEEMGLLKSRIGNLIATEGAVDDVIELVLIGFVLAVFQSSLTGYAIENLFIGMLAFVVLVAVFKLLIIPRALAFFEHENNRTELFTGALIITLLMAAIGQAFGVGSLIGAFLSGVLIRHVLVAETRQPWEEHALSHAIHTLAFGFFVPLFFVWVGYQVDVTSALQNLPLGALLSIVAIAGTVGGAVVGVLASGGTSKEGFIVGLGITSKGDMELVIAALALNNGLINQPVFSAIIFMALATTIVGPIAFRHFIALHKENKEKKRKATKEEKKKEK